MNKKTVRIIGWVLSGLLGLAFFASASFKFLGNLDEAMTGYGFSSSEITMIAIGEIVSTVLFLIPRTASLGKLLLSAYFGGAIATHMQAPGAEGNYTIVAVFLVLIWVASILRVPGTLASFKSE